MLTLKTPIEAAPHVGPKTAERLKKLDIHYVRDLLSHWPYRYEDFRTITPIDSVMPGMSATVRGVIILIANRRSYKRRMIVTQALIKDDTGTAKILWFNQGYLTKTLQPGDEILVAGKTSEQPGITLFPSPAFEKVKDDQTHVGRLVPMYHTTERVSQRMLRYILKELVPLMQKLPEYLPAELITAHHLPSLAEAYVQMHFPTDEKTLAAARRRLQFDELLLIHLHVLQNRRSLDQAAAQPLVDTKQQLEQLQSSLPYSLTEPQQRSLDEIIADLAKERPMNRLLEGDVGSGKTVVAALASAVAISAGSQVAFMAPTEVLALQHYKTLQKLLGSERTIALWTRGYRFVSDKNGSITKATIAKRMAAGTINLVVGTHALIQEAVTFQNLHFAIIDEQHRFGVNMRKAIRDKGSHPELTPHLLSMTATPIPRTLALTLYGDLDISLIDALPGGRKKIETEIIDQRHRDKAYAFINEQVAAGRQIFVICPLIEFSDKLGYRSVTTEFERLRTTVFPDLRIGMLHGKMKTEEKEQVITAMAKHEIDILVATSVIEVGIDIPNATVMMIEGADRFGLAQLHQFRGRVGRSEHQSYCLLFTESTSEQTIQRLRALTESADGFALAEKDLELRGPGELYGTRQSGEPDVMLANLLNAPLLKETKDAAEQLLRNDPTLAAQPKLQTRLRAYTQTIHWE